MTFDPGASPERDTADEDAIAGPPQDAPERTAGPSSMAASGMMTYPAGMLAGTADRDRALDVLKAGFAEGRLTQTDHDERVTRLATARTYGDLALLVADLPAGPFAVACYPPPQPRLPMFNSLAVASLICGLAELPTLGLTALPAVVYGTRARRQIRETGERGDGLAVAGLVLGWTAIALFFAAVLAMMIWLILPPAPGTGGPIGS